MARHHRSARSPHGPLARSTGRLIELAVSDEVRPIRPVQRIAICVANSTLPVESRRHDAAHS